MRALPVALLLALLIAVAPAQTPVRFTGRKPASANPTKQELVRWIGLPARIVLFEGPDREAWLYYCRGPDGRVSEFSFGFTNGRVSSSGAWPDPKTLLSTDREADLKLIAKYLRWVRAIH